MADKPACSGTNDKQDQPSKDGWGMKGNTIKMRRKNLAFAITILSVLTFACNLSLALLVSGSHQRRHLRCYGYPADIANTKTSWMPRLPPFSPPAWSCWMV